MWNLYMHPIWNWINATVTILKLLIVNALVILFISVFFLFLMLLFILRNGAHLLSFFWLLTETNKSTFVYMKRPTSMSKRQLSDRFIYFTICVLDYIGGCLFLTIFVSILNEKKIRKSNPYWNLTSRSVHAVNVIKMDFIPCHIIGWVRLMNFSNGRQYLCVVSFIKKKNL